jgi:hypothetical protein
MSYSKYFEHLPEFDRLTEGLETIYVFDKVETNLHSALETSTHGRWGDFVVDGLFKDDFEGDCSGITWRKKSIPARAVDGMSAMHFIEVIVGDDRVVIADVMWPYEDTTSSIDSRYVVMSSSHVATILTLLAKDAILA